MSDVFNKGGIDVKYVATEHMSANVLKKSLNACKHKMCCELIGLVVI